MFGTCAHQNFYTLTNTKTKTIIDKGLKTSKKANALN
jgi:hypothetical protein